MLYIILWIRFAYITLRANETANQGIVLIPMSASTHNN